MADDPYFFLYYGKAPRYPSYFALERENGEVGRVLRFDSLSKVLSAGIRIGFASGPEALLKAIDQHVCPDLSFYSHEGLINDRFASPFSYFFSQFLSLIQKWFDNVKK